MVSIDHRGRPQMRLGAAVGALDIHSFHGRSSPLCQNRTVEWSEVRADRIIQLSQSALLRVVHLPNQVGLKRRFKGIPAQRSHALGGIDFLAGDGLKAVDAHYPDAAAMVGGPSGSPFGRFYRDGRRGRRG